MTDQLTEKQKKFEEKIGNVGTSVARKEKEVQGILQDLWQALADIFLDREKLVTNKNKDERIEERQE